MQRAITTQTIVAVALVVTAVLASSSIAIADPTFTVMNAEGGIYWRSAPDWNTPEAISGFGVYNGTTVAVHCYQSGTSVPGSSDTMWEQATDVAGAGYGSGWLNEHFIDDGQPINQPSPGVPPCNGAETTSEGRASTGTGSTGSSPAPPNASYNRSAARDWALAHAKDPQAFGAMCTWFVSRALWAGDVPQTAAWTSAGTYHYGHFKSSVPGTQDAWVLPKFLTYLKSSFATTEIEITRNFRSNAVPQAEVGDLIVYDWGKGEGKSHVAMVVDIASGHYPEVAEMGQYDFGLVDAGINKLVHVHSSYAKRGWTWSAVHHEWLQHEFPKAKAYLVHINGGYTSSTF